MGHMSAVFLLPEGTLKSMRTFDGLRLDVRTYGPEDAAVTVALGHCWAVNQEAWLYQLRDLQREFGHAIRIVTWDHRGHGRSDKPRRHACTIENEEHTSELQSRQYLVCRLLLEKKKKK